MTENKDWTHRVYAKSKDMKRFGPLDVGKGKIVGNLIYASVFCESEAQIVVEKLRQAHPEIEFEVRKI